MKKILICYLSLEIIGLICDYFLKSSVSFIYHIWATYIIEFVGGLIICSKILQPYKYQKLAKIEFNTIPLILILSISLSILGSKSIQLLSLKISQNVQHFPSLHFFVLSVIIAPVAEEFFFRYFLLGHLLKIKFQRNYLITVVFSAFLFGLTHWTSGFGIMTFAFVLGIGYGMIYVYTKNITLCIFCHFCNNLLVFLASLIPHETNRVSNSSYLSSLIIFLIMLTVSIKLLLILRDKYYENNYL